MSSTKSFSNANANTNANANANPNQSTGPKSDAGKATSSKNATTHGFTATYPVIKSAQDKNEFNTLHESLQSDLKPAPGLEQVLFNQILIATWNMHRCDAHIADLAKRGLDPLDCTFAGAEMVTTTANLNSYYRRNERTLHRALATLRELQTERTHRELAQTIEKTKNISTLVRTQPIRRAMLHEDHLKTQIEWASIRNAHKVPQLPVTAYARKMSQRILSAV